MTFAEQVKGAGPATVEEEQAWREESVESRLSHALVKGIVEYIDDDVDEALDVLRPPPPHHRGAAHGGHERGR